MENVTCGFNVNNFCFKIQSDCNQNAKVMIEADTISIQHSMLTSELGSNCTTRRCSGAQDRSHGTAVVCCKQIFWGIQMKMDGLIQTMCCECKSTWLKVLAIRTSLCCPHSPGSSSILPWTISEKSTMTPCAGQLDRALRARRSRMRSTSSECCRKSIASWLWKALQGAS